jgi:hypothetical protein
MNLATAEFIVRAATAAVAVVGVPLAVMKYLNEKKKGNETAQIEARKPFSAKQQEIYFDLVSTTSLISNGNSDDLDHAKAREHFWILFWGALPMVATKEVAVAADAFSVALEDLTNDVALRNASMDLARACRRSLGKSWDVYMDDFDVSKASTATETLNT